MPREKGYASPLLSNLASDYSKKAREGLIAPIIFPRIPVGKPSGKYAVFDAETAFKVPDVAMAGERSRAAEFAASGKMRDYATSRYGIKSFIDIADLEFMDGPFKLWEKRKVELLVSKLEMAQEKRIADTISALSGYRGSFKSGIARGAENLIKSIWYNDLALKNSGFGCQGFCGKRRGMPKNRSYFTETGLTL